MDDAYRRPAAEGEDLADVSGAEPDETGDRRLFPGDRGRLPLEVRSALVRLLKGPYLDRSRSALWAAMTAYEDAVRDWLGEVFLELVVNHEDGVAFTRQIPAKDLKIQPLLRPARMTYFDAVMLLILRERLNRSEIAGERAVVGLAADEIKELLRLHGRSGETNLTVADSHVNATINRFVKEFKILKSLDGPKGTRYEISPVIKFLVTPALMADLAEELRSVKADLDVKGDILIGRVFGGDDAVIDSSADALPRTPGHWAPEAWDDLFIPDAISSTPIIIDRDEDIPGHSIDPRADGQGGPGQDDDLDFDGEPGGGDPDDFDQD